MATKSTLITNINNYISAVVTVVKHRLSMLELVNEIFPTSVDISTSSSSMFSELQFTKSGNKCLVTGSISSSSSSMIGNQKIFDISNSLFYPKVTQPIIGIEATTLQPVLIFVNDFSDASNPNSFFLSSNIGAGSEIIINATYIVND